MPESQEAVADEQRSSDERGEAESSHWKPTLHLPSKQRILSGLPTLLVFAATLAYILATVYTSLMKYYTFNATFEDLGVNNQILWLLSHGGVSNYNSSGFASFYPMQWQKPIIFVILPLYSVYPHPGTLLIIQSIALGLPAIPVYYLGRVTLGSKWLPAVIALAYLSYFPVASASLFDFQFENFTPLFYLGACLAWTTGRRRLACISAVLCAFVNPLALLLVLFFLLFTVFNDLPPSLPIGKLVNEAYHRLVGDRWRFVTIVLLPAMLLAYSSVGSLYTAGTGASIPGSTPIDILTYAINSKLMLFLFLFGALAFIPLFEPWCLWLIAPYIGWVVYSESSSHWQIFGLMYPVLVVGPIFYATILAFKHQDRLKDATDFDYFADSPRSARARYAKERNWRLGRRRERQAVPLVLAVCVFSAIYLPWSPINQYVSGGYFSGNHQYSTITSFTDSDQFLWQAINLIPENGSVLTQNGIPQVSGREYCQLDTGYNPNVPYDYIVADTNITFFNSFSTIQPFIVSAIQNHSFGVLAEGHSAILLERGYIGYPALFAPLVSELNSASLLAYTGTDVNGSDLVRASPGYSMWYGPYLTMYPGNYTALFRLSVNSTIPQNVTLLTLQVTSDNGGVLYAQQTLTGASFSAPNAWTTFALQFRIADVTTGFELRGMFPSGAATLTLSGITLRQLSYD